MPGMAIATLCAFCGFPPSSRVRSGARGGGAVCQPPWTNYMYIYLKTVGGDMPLFFFDLFVFIVQYEDMSRHCLHCLAC